MHRAVTLSSEAHTDRGGPSVAASLSLSAAMVSRVMASIQRSVTEAEHPEQQLHDEPGDHVDAQDDQREPYDDAPGHVPPVGSSGP